MKKNISVIGGDLRSLTVASLLSKDDYNTVCYGFDKETENIDVPCCTSLKEALNSEVITLPIPVSYDGIFINAPLFKEKIPISDIIKGIGSAKLVLAGCVSVSLQEEFDKEGIICIDYYNREELKVKNAVPTAEGALEIALSELPITLKDANALVIGYGRIGKILTKMLSSLNCDTTSSARRYSDLAWAEASGAKSVHTDKISSIIENFDVIFNTVPGLVLDENTLSKTKNDALIIDLASVPGGVDLEAAKALNKKVIWALSLPGKTAPISAGRIIKDTVLNILTELEEGYCGT